MHSIPMLLSRLTHHPAGGIVCLGILLTCALAGCNYATPSPIPTAIPIPTPLPTDTGWQEAASGIAWRQLQIMPEGAEQQILVYAVRIDPDAVTLRVHYAPHSPQNLFAWQRQTGAALLINGGFFTPEYTVLGLLVSDGQAHGQTYNGYGGMLQIVGGQARIRALATEPYHPGEPLDQAVQAFPMLLDTGGIPAYPDPEGKRARRSIVGQDRAGRLIFIVLPAGGLTLYETSRWLAASDLGLDIALNLDGGGSTALYFNVGDARRAFPAFDLLPIVIAVYLH